MKLKKDAPYPVHPTENTIDSLLIGGGEMGDLMRSIDWSSTSLGAPENWPQSLITSVNTLLNSGFGMLLMWGPDLVQFYNDAFRPSFGLSGEKHPQAMGQRARDCWGEIWDIIYPQFHQVMTEAEAIWNENMLVPIYRNDIFEEVYWTYTYCPVFDEKGDVGGILVVVSETSLQVIGERRTVLLRDLAVKLNAAQNIDSVFINAIQILDGAKTDFPFSLLYKYEKERNAFELSDAVNIQPAHTILTNTAAFQNIFTIAENNHLIINDLDDFDWGAIEEEIWPEPTKNVAIAPLYAQNSKEVLGVYVCGLSARLVPDAEYKGHIASVAMQISSSIVTVRSYEEEKKRAQALEELDKAKTLFFNNISHEFRTPLTLMLSPLQDIINDSSSEYHHQLKMVYDNGLRLQKLVNNLLDFSQIEAGRVNANFVPIDLANYTAELASTFRAAIEKAGLKLKVDLQEISEPIFIDRDMWEKIVFNLLSNAFKYTFEGNITVQLSEANDAVVLKVMDTGEGIAEENLERIFERFNRIEVVKARSHEGSGIGLSMVQELVKLHHGEIKVESKSGEGTTFTITIPKGAKHLPEDYTNVQVVEPDPIPRGAAFKAEIEQWLDIDSHSEEQQRPRGREDDVPFVILADDNADMRKYIKRLLSTRFDLQAVSNGFEALSAIDEHTPDLLIADIMMPGMDGFELFRKLRANSKTANIPVLMLSAKAGEQARLEGMEAGVDHYLEKPFSSNELVAKVTSIVAVRRAKNEMETRLYELLMNAPAFIALLNGPNHVFEWCNPNYMSLIGKKREIIGKPVIEALPEVRDQEFPQLLDKVYQTGRPFYGNELSVKVDRRGLGELEIVYLNFVYHPQKNHAGKINGIFVHGVDVTDQVLARKKVEETENKLSAIINQATAGIAQADIDSNFIFVNERFCQIVGYTSDELCKMSWREIIHPEDLHRSTSLFNELTEAGKNFKEERRLIHKDGHAIWVNDNVSLVQDKSVKLQTILTVTIDITERKKAEELLLESEDDFRTLADNIPNICWMADPQGDIYWFNSRWYEYTGVQPGVRGKQGWHHFHDPVMLPEVLDQYNTSVSTATTFEMVHPLLGAEGEFKPFLSRMIPVRDEDGNVLKWFGTSTDIAEREKLARQKDEFIGIASHELKTPVTSIKAYTQVLLNKFESEEDEVTASMLSKMDKQLNRLTGLISDLLDGTQIEQGKLKLRKEKFDFNELVTETVEEIQRTTIKHSIEVDLCEFCTVVADRDRIGQVITNFLTNAIKYSPKNDRILVRTYYNEGELFLSVRDFGIGLSKEERYNVFERFYRVGETGHETFPGLGLGLFISAEIIHRHYGEIWAESEKGKGSIFYFTLPLHNK